MDHNTPSSSDLIDNLARTYFGIEPDVMAKLAHGDEQARLRIPPDVTEIVDPLEGLEVLARRIIAACLAMREHQSAISLLTVHQAQEAGWPSARVANMVIVLALALYNVRDPDVTSMVLVEASETTPSHSMRLIGISKRLPSLEELLKSWDERSPVEGSAVERTRQERESALLVAGSRRVSWNGTLQEWLQVDANNVDLREDRRVDDGDDRAMQYFGRLAIESLNMGRVMQTEGIKAVRIKTEEDARIARLPGAVAANFALLLGAAVCHGSGYTVHFLPARDDFAAKLIEAGQQFQGGAGLTLHHKMAERLELEDIAGRGYVHVGRLATACAASWTVDRFTPANA